MSTLRNGDEGSEVRSLQGQLNHALGTHLSADGEFGDRTEAAVRTFQRNHGLTEDGVAGPRTLAALERASATPHPAKPANAPPPPPPNVAPGPAAHDGDVSLAQLRAVYTHLKLEKAQQYLPFMNAAMREFAVNSTKRKAAFLGQIGHESAEFRYMAEIASGIDYDISRNPRKAKNLGNVNPGDGPRYKGRGPIQLTGRSNYRTAGRALGLPLEENPPMAEQPDVAFRTSGFFWKSHGLNELADVEDYREITRRINGGYTHYDERVVYWNRAKQVLATMPYASAVPVKPAAPAHPSGLAAPAAEGNPMFPGFGFPFPFPI